MVILVSKPKFLGMRIPSEMMWIWLEHVWYYIMTYMMKKQQNGWPLQTNINEKSKSAASNTNILKNLLPLHLLARNHINQFIWFIDQENIGLDPHGDSRYLTDYNCIAVNLPRCTLPSKAYEKKPSCFGQYQSVTVHLLNRCRNHLN